MAKPVFDVVFRAEHVLHQRQFSPLEIGVRDGKIEAIEPLGAI